MAFRLSHIHDYSRCIAIDLGVHRVRVGIYDILPGSSEEIGFSSVRQSRRNWIDGQVADIRGIATTVEQAIIGASRDLDTIPDSVIVSFPSRGFVSDVITTQYIRADATVPITMHEVDQMISRIEGESQVRAKTRSQRQFGIQSDDLRLISSTIVAITIDGRTVTSPIGFAGSRLRLTVLNVFAPSSEFNMIRSILSTLDKHAISIIPEPLILPKVVESLGGAESTTAIIDVGQSHITVTLMDHGQIIGFEIFAYGVSDLIELMAEAHPGKSLLQIENIISTPETARDGLDAQIIREWVEYIEDIILGYIHTEYPQLRLQELLLHGSVFQNSEIYSVFTTVLDTSHGYPAQPRYIYTGSSLSPERVMTHGLSLIAHELLLAKKDPLVRVLRYVLYQYE